MQNPLLPHRPQLAPALQFCSSLLFLSHGPISSSPRPLAFLTAYYFNASLCFTPFHCMCCVSTVGRQKDWDMFRTFCHKVVPKSQILQRAVNLKQACNTKMKRPQDELSIWKSSVSYFIKVSIEHV